MAGEVENTDIELWSDDHDDPFTSRLFATMREGGIGVSVGGRVYVKTLKEWHALAVAADDSNDAPA